MVWVILKDMSDSFTEQRLVSAAGGQFLDTSAGALVISGADRISWLNSLITKNIVALHPGQWAQGLILDQTGHIQFHLWIICAEDKLYIETSTKQLLALYQYLSRMIFWSKVTVDILDSITIVRLLTSHVPPSLLYPHYLQSYGDVQLITLLTDGTLLPEYEPIGADACTAYRIAACIPDLNCDVDEKTLPHELNLVCEDPDDLRSAVTLHKGCYRGQETVSKIHNLGKPPRRLVLLHMAESCAGDDIVGSAIYEGAGPSSRVIGKITSYADHFELGAIGLGMIKRSVPWDATLGSVNSDRVISLSIDADFYYPDTVGAGKQAVQQFLQNKRANL